VYRHYLKAEVLTLGRFITAAKLSELLVKTGKRVFARHLLEL